MIPAEPTAYSLRLRAAGRRPQQQLGVRLLSASRVLACLARLAMSWAALCCFFSSRRRHTRLQGDWSSDVCSSDLSASRRSPVPNGAAPLSPARPERSDERRVGKEGRSRWSTYHYKIEKYCMLT